MTSKQSILTLSAIGLILISLIHAVAVGNAPNEGAIIDAQGKQMANDVQLKYDALASNLRHSLRNIQQLGFHPLCDTALVGSREVGDRNESNALRKQMSEDEQALILAAGYLRAECCVELLLNRIAVFGLVPKRSPLQTPIRQNCPAFESLCRIGVPSCDKALKRLRDEPDGLTRVYIAGLLQTCLGDHEARKMLTKAVNSTAEGADAKARIQEAISQIDDGPCPLNLRLYHKSRSTIE